MFNLTLAASHACMPHFGSRAVGGLRGAFGGSRCACVLSTSFARVHIHSMQRHCPCFLAALLLFPQGCQRLFCSPTFKLQAMALVERNGEAPGAEAPKQSKWRSCRPWTTLFFLCLVFAVSWLPNSLSKKRLSYRDKL